MGPMRMIMMGAVVFSLCGSLFAVEKLEIKGSFAPELKSGYPEGWYPNKPRWWDEEGKITLNKISGTEKVALQVASITKEIHLYSTGKEFTSLSKRWNM